jgi:serine/threonine-protein kinase
VTADSFDRLRTALACSFTIERELGQGGMATVYLARDLKNGRQVAIKVLRPELAAAVGSDRFLREIRLVAPLSHPHILPLYDSGEADGILYFVMPYVEGESLRHRLDRGGRLTAAEATRLAAEVAGALEYAHQHGVVHRDIKPENILLQSGQAVVCDFGIAKAIDAASDGDSTRLTSTGIAIGTPFYMSPEQVSGEGIDGRTDIYSLGCMLFEMLEGVPPYSGNTAAALLVQHSVAPLPPLTASVAGPATERIIHRAMAKTPADRFATAGAMRDALLGNSSAPTLEVSQPSRARKFPRSAVVAVVLAALALGGYGYRRFGSHLGREQSIAVLNFKNPGDDPAIAPFSAGVSEEITTALDKVPGLHVAARSLLAQFQGEPAQYIGQKLHVRYVLDGGVRVGGTRRRVSVQLIDVGSGTELWSNEYDRDATDPDVFAVQDSIARAVVSSLRIHLSDSARSSLAIHSTANPRAHDLYLKGRYYWNQRGAGFAAALPKAIDFFSQAIALDSSYAEAFAARAEAYAMVPVFGSAPPAVPFANAKADVIRAFELDSTLANAHTARAMIDVFYDWNWHGAAAEFRRALELDSTDVRAHQFHGIQLTAIGQTDSALAELRTAQRLDPTNGIIKTRIGTTLTVAGRYPEAEAAYRQALALDPTNFNARAELGTLIGQEGHYDSALAMLRAFDDSVHLIIQGGYLLAGPLGYLYGISGHQPEARRIQRFLESMQKKTYVMPLSHAMVALGLGDTTRALNWIDSAYREHSALVPFLGMPEFDALRGQPRFDRVVRDIGVILPAAGGKR